MENVFLKKAKWCAGLHLFALMLLTGGPAFLGFYGDIQNKAMLLYIFTFFALHFFLIRTAKESGRSWVAFGILPILVPGGGIFSYLILASKVKNEVL